MCHATPSNPPIKCCRFRDHLCSHRGLAGAIPSMAERRPSTLSVASEATQQSPKVGNANQSCKCSAKACESKCQEQIQHPFIRCFQSKRLMFPPMAIRYHVLCAWNRRLNTKFGVARCVSSNIMEVGSRLKQQETRVANITCSTQRSWHGCVGRRSSKRTISTTTLQKPSMKGLATMDAEDGKACSTLVDLASGTVTGHYLLLRIE